MLSEFIPSALAQPIYCACGNRVSAKSERFLCDDCEEYQPDDQPGFTYEQQAAIEADFFASLTVASDVDNVLQGGSQMSAELMMSLQIIQAGAAAFVRQKDYLLLLLRAASVDMPEANHV